MNLMRGQKDEMILTSECCENPGLRSLLGGRGEIYFLKYFHFS